MELKRFSKNDSGFVCVGCGVIVAPLGITSRDHCNVCLAGLHVDINPGDRENKCRGVLKPIGIRVDAKKGYIIIYRCAKCGKEINNKAAGDDNFEEILRASKPR